MTFTHAHVWTRWEEGVEHFHHTLFHLKNITFIIGSCPTSLNIISLYIYIYIYIRYFPHYEFHLPKVTTENTSSGLFSAQYLRPTNQVQATFEFKTEKIREDTDLPTSVFGDTQISRVCRGTICGFHGFLGTKLLCFYLTSLYIDIGYDLINVFEICLSGHPGNNL